MTKKVAVCLSGGVKFLEKGLNSIKQLSDIHDVKVFGHTWKINDKEDFGKNSWTGFQTSKESPNDSLLKLILECQFERIIIDNFEEKKPLFEKLFQSIGFSITDRKDVGPLSMFYSIHESNRIRIEFEKETGRIADVIIRMRYDSNIINPEQLDLNSVEEDVLYIPEGQNWNGINDQFAYGSNHVMNIYASLILNLKQFTGKLYNPEAMLKHYLTLANVKIQRPNITVKINNQ